MVREKSETGNRDQREGGLKRLPTMEERAERYELILKIRAEGGSFKDIQEALGYRSRTNAYEALIRARRWAGLTLDSQKLVEDATAQLDAMLESLASLIVDGNPRAVEVAVKVLERKSRLLGLDAPEKHLVKGQFSVESRITEVTPTFLADTIRELNTTNPRALGAPAQESVDSAQADGKTGGVSSRATA